MRQAPASANPCRACGRTFRTPQGLGGHLKHSKDSAHTGYREAGTIPPYGAPPPVAEASPPGSRHAPPAAPAPEPLRAEAVERTVSRATDLVVGWLKRAPHPKPAPKAPSQPTPQRGPQSDSNSPPEVTDYWKRVLGSSYQPPRGGSP